MDFKLELVGVPVSDIDRAKAFYADQVGFVVDVDQTVSDDIRFVQLTPPGSACSIAIGKGLTTMAPGSLDSMQMVVADAAAAREELLTRGVSVSEVDVQPWGSFVYFADPDGNGWALQQLPDWSRGARGFRRLQRRLGGLSAGRLVGRLSGGGEDGAGRGSARPGRPQLRPSRCRTTSCCRTWSCPGSRFNPWPIHTTPISTAMMPKTMAVTRAGRVSCGVLRWLGRSALGAYGALTG